MRKKFLTDLEVLFERALEKEDFSAALKAKELLGKAEGFFLLQGTAARQSSKPLNASALKEALTEEMLEALIHHLEEFLGESVSPKDGPHETL
jgi:hypothetical protein